MKTKVMMVHSYVHECCRDVDVKAAAHLFTCVLNLIIM